MAAPSVTVPLAEGFEEIEALAPVDVWRRLGFRVKLAGIASRRVVGSHGVAVEADALLSDDEPLPDALALPGGMPGSANLRDSAAVLALCRRAHAAGRVVAAICAAPIALHAAGVLNGKRITSHPSVSKTLGGAVHVGGRAVRDGNIVTAMGPGASFEFAAAVADALGAGEAARRLLAEMFVS